MAKNPPETYLIIVSIFQLALATLMFKKPGYFVGGGYRSRMLIQLVGEEGAKQLVRYFCAPFLVVVAFFCFARANGWLGMSGN